MANIASAEKKNRQRVKRDARNHHHLATMRTSVKKVRAALADEDMAKAQQAYAAAVCVIDKTAQKGAIHKATASRTKSRLALALNRLAGESKSA